MDVSKKSIVGRLAAVESEAVRIDQSRCAKVRNRNVECLACARACTSGCIALSDAGELAVDESRCVGCGTCATVCPTCAIESRNPSDAQLTAACLASAREGHVTVMCSRAKKALAHLLEEGRFAEAVCLGRIDESLLCTLAACGVQTIDLAHAECSACAQKTGFDTALLVANTTETLLDAFGGRARIAVRRDVSASCLARGVRAADATAALRAFSGKPCACEPVRGDGHTCRDASAASEAAKASFDEDAKTSGRKTRKPFGAHDAHDRSDVPDAAESGRTDDESESGIAPHAAKGRGGTKAFPLPHVMADGTLPHFIPDRRERLVDALSSFDGPRCDSVSTRLWGCVVIDPARCSSCRMCATFCPTAAIGKFDDEDAMGVLHTPADCVKCGSCRDICPEGAITIRDEVKTGFILNASTHRYAMRPRAVKIGDPHQILETMKGRIEGNVYER